MPMYDPKSKPEQTSSNDDTAMSTSPRSILEEILARYEKASRDEQRAKYIQECVEEGRPMLRTLAGIYFDTNHSVRGHTRANPKPKTAEERSKATKERKKKIDSMVRKLKRQLLGYSIMMPNGKTLGRQTIPDLKRLGFIGNKLISLMTPGKMLQDCITLKQLEAFEKKWGSFHVPTPNGSARSKTQAKPARASKTKKTARRTRRAA